MCSLWSESNSEVALLQWDTYCAFAARLLNYSVAVLACQCGTLICSVLRPLITGASTDLCSSTSTHYRLLRSCGDLALPLAVPSACPPLADRHVYQQRSRNQRRIWSRQGACPTTIHNCCCCCCCRCCCCQWSARIILILTTTLSRPGVWLGALLSSQSAFISVAQAIY